MRVTFVSLAILFMISKQLCAQNEVDGLRKQGDQETSSGDFVSADRDLTAALAKAKSANDFTRQYLCEVDLSRLNERQNDLARAEQWLQTAAATLKTSKKISPLPALMDLDLFYARHAMHGQAIVNLHQMIELWNAAAGPDSVGAARYKTRLGDLCLASGDYPSAEQPLRSALVVFQKHGPILNLAAENTQRALIKALSAEGKIDEAQQLRASLPPAPLPRQKPDVRPQLIAKKEPEYSETARKLKISGTVRLSLDVDETGHPQNIQILLPLGEGLDENAIAAVSNWVFHPALKRGLPVGTHATVEVSFRLL